MIPVSNPLHACDDADHVEQHTPLGWDDAGVDDYPYTPVSHRTPLEPENDSEDYR